MRKEDVLLLNRLLTEMRRLSDELEESFKKQDFEGVLKIKKQIGALQKKVGEII
ncbi:MAG: hypothetical protein AABX96_04205 [Nanoarchaeota archaeon]